MLSADLIFVFLLVKWKAYVNVRLHCCICFKVMLSQLQIMLTLIDVYLLISNLTGYNILFMFDICLDHEFFY